MNTALELPRTVYGVAKDVRRHASSAVRAFVSGTPWSDAIGQGSLVAAASSPGFIVLTGPAPLLRDEPHFHAFMPLMLVIQGVRDRKISEAKLDEAVTASLSTPWGLLGVLSPPNQLVVYPPSRHKAIAEAAVTFWETLDSVGERYSVGLREGARLWNVTTNLRYVLARIGVSDEHILGALPGGLLRNIVPPDALG